MADGSPGTFRAIVVGAGIVGASVAYHLARRGVTSVLLVDKDGIGSGATGRSGGMVRTHLPHPGLAALARYGGQAYARFYRELGEPIGYEQNGALTLVPPEQVPLARATLAHQQAAGADARLLPPAAAAALVPGLDRTGWAAAVLEPAAGHADAYRAAVAYADAARALGVTVRLGVAVTDLLQEGGRAAGVMTARGPARAPAVILAAGAWSGRLAAGAGLALPVRPALRRVALVLPAGEYGPERPAVYDLGSGTYWRPEGPQMLLVGGGERELAEVRHGEADPDDPPGWADDEFVVAALAGLTRRLPGQGGASVGGTWAGVDGTTPDLLPILGEVPGLPGLYCACGMSGHGFKLAPAVGAALAELVATGTCAGFGLAPFTPARFAAGLPPAPADLAAWLP